MIYTNENADFYARRAKFDKAIKDECKEIGSINCLSRVVYIITQLAEDDASNIYNGKPLNDAHLTKMLELHDACKQNKPEYTSFYDDSGKEILKLQPQFKTESGELRNDACTKDSFGIRYEDIKPRK